MVKSIQTLRTLAILVISICSHAAWGGSSDVSYDTGNVTNVDISLANPDQQTALLSFYSEGENGLRLLENSFTDNQGHFGGQLQLPMHLTQIVMIVRTNDRQTTLTLPINNNAISYSE